MTTFLHVRPNAFPLLVEIGHVLASDAARSKPRGASTEEVRVLTDAEVDDRRVVYPCT